MSFNFKNHFKRNKRIYYLALNDYVAVSHICPELHVGSNEVSKEEAISLSRILAENPGKGRILKKRCQNADMLWNLWHDPYDEKPKWLNICKIKKRQK